jgi:hypothetical protein
MAFRAENVHRLFWSDWFEFDCFIRVNPATSRAPLIQIFFDMMPAEEADLLEQLEDGIWSQITGKTLPDIHKGRA